MKSVFTIVLTVLLLSTPESVFSSKSHAVTTLLNAKWDAPPIYLEIAEFLGVESENFYWDYLSHVINAQPALADVENDQKRYKVALNLASTILLPTQQNILKLSLALHSLTPLIQSHFQISNDAKKLSGCKSSIFVQTSDSYICELKDLGKVASQQPSEGGDGPDLYEFDHVYPGSNSSSNVVILFGDIGTAEFSRWYKVLKSKVDKGLIKLIIRNYVALENSRKVRLSGYGVELHLKSTEYKSQDDSAKTVTETDPIEEDQDDDEVEGINFKTLKYV